MIMQKKPGYCNIYLSFLSYLAKYDLILSLPVITHYADQFALCGLTNWMTANAKEMFIPHNHDFKISFSKYLTCTLSKS